MTNERQEKLRGEGRQAFNDGRAVNTCPYPRTSNERNPWQEGFFEAEAAQEAVAA